jgi:hypothetical protein
MPPDLTFLSTDVRRQREIAQSALEEAKRLDELLKSSNPPPEFKEELERAKGTLLQVAKELAANVSTTSTIASNVISNLKR